MTYRRLALTGPSAAALYRLDGFRDIAWPDLWCAPITGASGDRIVRTRHWTDPTYINDIAVAPVEVVLRHLNAVPADLAGQRDRALDRVVRFERESEIQASASLWRFDRDYGRTRSAYASGRRSR